MSNASGLGDVDVDEYGQWSRAVGPDGYNSTWTLAVEGEVCGNGTLEGSEECDDGNTASEDGCSSSCMNEFCADNVLQPGLGEACDDGNMVNGDGCSDVCAFEPGVYVPLASDGMLALLVASMLLGGVLLLSRGARKGHV